MKQKIKLNTSSHGKFEEFKILFDKFGIDLEISRIDLKEIDSDPIQVIAHKASQLQEGVVADDTSLEIDGASVGINVRWLLDHLSEYAGHKAVWTVLLAFRSGPEIFIYKGILSGTIVMPRGLGGFGFDPVFLPDGSTYTLAEFKPDSLNARFKAVEALINENVWIKHPAIEEWDGLWQKDN